jgi:hypothetical protein
MATALKEAPPVYYGASRDILANDSPEDTTAPETDPLYRTEGVLPFPTTPDPYGLAVPGLLAGNAGQFLGGTLPTDTAAAANAALMPNAPPMAPMVPTPNTPLPPPAPDAPDPLDNPYPTLRPYNTAFPDPIAPPLRGAVPTYDAQEEARRVARVTNNPWLKAAAIGLSLLGGEQGLKLGTSLLPALATGARTGAQDALGAAYGRDMATYQAKTQADQQDFADQERARQEQIGNIEAGNQITGEQNRADIAKWTAEGARAQAKQAEEDRDKAAKARAAYYAGNLKLKQQTEDQKAATAQLNAIKPLLKAGQMTPQGQAAVADLLRRVGGVSNLPDDFINSMTPQQKAALDEASMDRTSRENMNNSRIAAENMRNQDRINAANQRQKSMQTFTQQFKKTGAGPGSQLFGAWKSVEVSMRAEDSRINSLRQAQQAIDRQIAGVKKSAAFASPKSPNGVNQAGQDQIDSFASQRQLYDRMITEHQNRYDEMEAQAKALLSTPDLAAVGNPMAQGSANYQATQNPIQSGWIAPGSPEWKAQFGNSGTPAAPPIRVHVGPAAGGSLAPAFVPPRAPGAPAGTLPEGVYHDPNLGVTVHITRGKKPLAKK